MLWIELFLIIIMLIGAAVAVGYSDLINSVIALSLVSLITSILFFVMQAPDVALTEASVGAGLTTAVFVMAINKIRNRDRKNEKNY
jgi:energy-converting hydrogenase B subunit D